MSLEDVFTKLVAESPIAVALLLAQFFWMRYARQRDDQFSKAQTATSEALKEVAVALARLEAISACSFNGDKETV